MCRHIFLISNSDYVNLWLSMPLLTHTVATLPLESRVSRSRPSSVHTTLYDYASVESGSPFWNSLLDPRPRDEAFTSASAASPASLKGSMTTIFS
jgi:hypothetical protein